MNVPSPVSRMHVGDLLAGGQVLAELADAAGEAELRLPRPPPSPSRRFGAGLGAGLRADRDRQAGHQVGGLPGPLGQAVVAERGVAQEHLAVRPEPDPGAGPWSCGTRAIWRSPDFLLKSASGRPRLGELAGDAAAEAGRPGVAVPVHLDVQPRGQRVHHGRADAVQAAGGGVGAAAELAARVQPGHDELDAGQLGLALVVDRDAAAVVADLGGAVGVQDDLDPGAVAAERLVDRVVEDLPEAVLQPAAVGRADVHAGALAHRVQALEDRQVLGAVGVGQFSLRPVRWTPPSPGRFL